MSREAEASKDVIETAGEVFPGGQMIDMLAGAGGGDPRLLLWSGKRKMVESSCVEYKGKQYRPVSIERSIARELVLPGQLGTCGSTRELLHSYLHADKTACQPSRSARIGGGPLGA